MSVTPELSTTVSKLLELNKQITDAKSDIKVLTDAEKVLKETVKKCMMDQGIDTINLKKGKISIKTSVRTMSVNKESVRAGLHAFFGGNEAQVEGALTAIQDNLQTKESRSLSITGIKEKN